MRGNVVRVVVMLTMILSLWVAASATALAQSPGELELAIQCTAVPEEINLTNHSTEALDMSGWTIGSLYQPRPEEPFTLSGTLDAGATATFYAGETGTNPDVLTGNSIFSDNEPTEGARLITSFGTLEVLCSAGSGTIAVPGSDTPPPAMDQRPAFSGLTPAPFTTVAPGPVRLAVQAHAKAPLTAFTMMLDGAQLNPEIGGPSETDQSAFIEQTLAAGVHTLTAEATDEKGATFRAQWDFVVAANPAETEWFTANGQPKAEQINATMRSLVEAFRWHLYGQSWDGSPHPELPSHVAFAGQAEPLAPWVNGASFDQARTEATLRSLVEVFRWHFWGIAWENVPHCDVPTHIPDCNDFLAPQPIEPWFTASGQPISDNIEATMRSLVESFRWHFWGYSWDGSHHPDIPTHAY